MAVLKNRAKMSTSTTGTGTITLGSAESGYQTFADAGVANADVVRYVIEDGNNFEIGTGTYTSSGTTLSRTVSESSNSNNAINLSGSATVFIGATAEDIPALYAENTTLSVVAPIATGNDSISLGSDANSSGTDSIAIMNGNASGTSSLAAVIANNTTTYGAQGSGSISIGTLSKATAIAGTAVGYGATSTHVAASAFGTSATTTATNQIALGGSGITARISGAYNLPTSDGTNGQVLTTNGSGAVTFADAGGGGDPDLYRDNAVNATTPTAAGDNGIAIGSNAVNTTTHGSKNGLAIGTNAVADYWATALGAGTDATGNSSLAVGYNSQATGSKSTAIMNSYASGESSFAAVIDNNTSSYGAGNYSNIAMGANAKATSGGSTVAIGAGTVASGNFSAAVGANCEATSGSSAFGRASDATGGFSLALGASNLASQFYSVAIGNNAKSEIKGKLAYGSGRFTTNGDVQAGTFILRMASTSGSPAVLTSDGNTTADTINQIVLPNNSCYGFTGTVIARENSSQTDDFAVWEIKGGAVRGANAASTTLGSYNINKISESSGAANWSIALSADTTNGAVAITVTGEASHSIRWVATVNTTEVTY